jgi:predicted nucleic acid-binding protein
MSSQAWVESKTHAKVDPPDARRALAGTPLVDTRVLAELAGLQPNAGVAAWAAGTHRIALSVVTLEELTAGIARRPYPALRTWLDAFVARHCEVLDVTAPIARLAGTLRGQLAARRRTRPQADLLVVATAAHHGLVLVTRNVRELGGLGVSLLNPFA